MAAKFQDQLSQARTRLGLSRAQLAKILKVDPVRIAGWERGDRTPRPLTQFAIMNRLKTAGAGNGSRGKQAKSRVGSIVLDSATRPIVSQKPRGA